MRTRLTLGLSLLLSGCGSMTGVDDALTFIGIMIAMMAGAYYFLNKLLGRKKKDTSNEE